MRALVSMSASRIRHVVADLALQQPILAFRPPGLGGERDEHADDDDNEFGGVLAQPASAAARRVHGG
jgi:hypothetical protein